VARPLFRGALGRNAEFNVAPDGISVTLHAACIRSLVAELAEPGGDCSSVRTALDAAEC
jgi:hypothetical protein